MLIDGGLCFCFGYGYVIDDGWDGWVFGFELLEMFEVEIFVGRFFGFCFFSFKVDKGFRI